MQAIAPVGPGRIMRADLTREGIHVLVTQGVHQVSASTILADEPLMEHGIDSLAATELTSSMQSELGPSFKLPTTLVFEHPTVTDIVEYICSQRSALSHAASSDQAVPQANSSQTTVSRTPTAAALVANAQMRLVCPVLASAGLRHIDYASGQVRLTMPINDNHQHTG